MSTTMTTWRAHRRATSEESRLENAVDRLADAVESLLHGSGEFVCDLGFDEAHALAEVLDAGHRTRTAARLMHQWALTEPDWGEDAALSAALGRWLALSVARVAVDA